MAIAFSQATTGSSSGGSNTTHSFNANGLASVSSVTNGIAFVLYDSPGLSTDPTSVTWGGQAMTKIATVNQTTRANTQSLWYRIAPATGNVTVADTYASASSPNMIWAVYSGVNQTTPPANNTGSTTVANNLSVSVTTLSANSWVVSAFTNNLGVGIAGSNTTSRFSNVLAIGDTGGPVVTPSSQAQNWSLASSTNWTGIVVVISPVIIMTMDTAAYILSGVVVNIIAVGRTVWSPKTKTAATNITNRAKNAIINITNKIKH